MSAVEMEDILKAGLFEHNKIRKMYGVKNLMGDSTMHEESQKHANFVANTKLFTPVNMRNWGTKIATSQKDDKTDAIKEAVKEWIGENGYYFINPRITRVGLGIAQCPEGSENKWIIVALYENGHLLGGDARSV